MLSLISGLIVGMLNHDKVGDMSSSEILQDSDILTEIVGLTFILEFFTAIGLLIKKMVKH